MQDRAEHTEQVSVSLQSEGLNSLGITFQFDDSQQLIIEEIKPDGIAAKVHLICRSHTIISDLRLSLQL